jgi:hypothetical protein
VIQKGCPVKIGRAALLAAHARRYRRRWKDKRRNFPVYATTLAVAQQVIGECYAFEYYLVAKDLGWLLCANHHDLMMGLGGVHDRLLAGRP